MSTQPIDGSTTASKRDLIRGTAIAAVVAGIILTIAVLPAEYGIDPTGIGKALGLTALHDQGAVAVTPVPTAAAAPVVSTPATIASKQATPYRADTREITLPPGKGLEIKTDLAKGATLIYTWKTKNGEKINHDFHGEPLNAKNDEFESFILEEGVSESRGSLIAPFTGTHGWYWANKTAAPVTVILHTSGFYTDIVYK